jgi:AraC-like DNA-binding protein
MREYREFAPPVGLGRLVECGWRSTVSRGEPAHRQRVLPDGCMDLIWWHGELLVAGPDTHAFLATHCPGGTVTGLRFRPGAAPGLIGVSAAELRNSRVPLAELNPALARRASALVDAGHSAGRALTTAVWDTVTATGSAWAQVPVPTLNRAALLLRSGASVASTADTLGWTTRTLHRHTRQAFGYGPATLRRVLRFRRALNLAWAGVPAAEIAASTGYADQPHLAREVRALAGVPLGRLLADVGEPSRAEQRSAPQAR